MRTSEPNRQPMTIRPEVTALSQVHVGQVVHVLVDPQHNNGADIAPALVTRVWGGPYTSEYDKLGERVTVNVRVLKDQQDIQWLTSIMLLESRPAETLLAEANTHNPNGYNAVAFLLSRDA